MNSQCIACHLGCWRQTIQPIVQQQQLQRVIGSIMPFPRVFTSWHQQSHRDITLALDCGLTTGTLVDGY